VLYAPPELFGSMSGLLFTAVSVFMGVGAGLVDYAAETLAAGRSPPLLQYQAPFLLLGLGAAALGAWLAVHWMKHPPPLLASEEEEKGGAEERGRALAAAAAAAEEEGRAAPVAVAPKATTKETELTELLPAAAKRGSGAGAGAGSGAATAAAAGDGRIVFECTAQKFHQSTQAKGGKKQQKKAPRVVVIYAFHGGPQHGGAKRTVVAWGRTAAAAKGEAAAAAAAILQQPPLKRRGSKRGSIAASLSSSFDDKARWLPLGPATKVTLVDGTAATAATALFPAVSPSSLSSPSSPSRPRAVSIVPPPGGDAAPLTLEFTSPGLAGAFKNAAESTAAVTAFVLADADSRAAADSWAD
jgi:hypothetical protein